MFSLVFLFALPLAFGALAGPLNLLPEEHDPADGDDTTPMPKADPALTPAEPDDLHPGYDPFGDRSFDALLLGHGGANVHMGDDSAEEIHARGGDDFIQGAAGDDSIDGAAGDDRLFGGAGDDVVHGSGGADAVYGGAGNDQLTGEYVEGGAGDDTIAPQPYQLSQPYSDYQAHLGGTGEGITAHGQDGNDALFGGSGDDTLFGGAGDDVLSAGGGADALDGGAGRDQLYGLSGGNTLIGGADDDEIFAPSVFGHGANTALGGDGDDTLMGVSIAEVGASDLQIIESRDPVALMGQEGDDHLWLDANVTASGGAGNDVFAMGRTLDALERDYTDAEIPRITDYALGSDRLVLQMFSRYGFPDAAEDMGGYLTVTVEDHTPSAGTLVLVNGTPALIVEGVQGLTADDVVVQHADDQTVDTKVFTRTLP